MTDTRKEQLLRGWIVLSWITLCFSVVGWPITALTIFSKEPQGILGLSWLAIVLGALGNLVQVYIFREVKNGE